MTRRADPNALQPETNSAPGRFARWLLLGLLLALAGCAARRELVHLVVPEQRTLDIREPTEIQTAPLPRLPEPATVAKPAPTGKEMELSLDEALRIALANSKVVRVLAGTTAVSSGRTIYDPAIANTAVDSARSVFDPVIVATNNFSRSETPIAFFDPTSPTGASIPESRINNYELGLGITKKLVAGGSVSLEGARTHSVFVPGPAPLNPQERSSITLSYTQPLLQGAGVAANVASILIARINTERSYFQLKNSMQDMASGVIEAYWQVVFARTDVWARSKQVEQADFTYKRAEALRKAGFGSDGEVGQAKTALMNFKATLIAAEANLLEREAALRNILGLPPTEPERFVPTTPPTPERFDPKWDEIVSLAEQMRPDLIELALVLEADQQSIVQARNQALPKVDAAMFYRWNGLQGTAPTGAYMMTRQGQFADWSLGVNFSVPLGLRDARAKLRSAELLLTADRANLEQGLHFATHQLAASVRNLAQRYQQYEAYREMRTAARVNLEQQFADVAKRGSLQLNLLQAITDWGNAVSFEAQALALYNTELANLERETGTILESHGIRFAEERSGFIGPLGRLAKCRPYPSSTPPEPNVPRYLDSAEPAEKKLEREMPKLREISPPAKEKLPEAPAARTPRPEVMTAPRLGTPRVESGPSTPLSVRSAPRK